MASYQTNNFNQLIDSYIISVHTCLSQENAPSTKDVSYKALLRMNCETEPENGEKKRQDKLVDKSGKMGYEHVLGYNRTTPGKISFCQFSTNGYSINDDTTEVDKLYINCDRDKIACISKELMKAAKKSKTDITFKMTYEDGISDNYKRADNIVIYTESAEQKQRIVSMLTDIHGKDHKLFNPNKSLPFMPKIESAPYVCCCGPQKAGRYTPFKGLDTPSKLIPNTWNAKMAEVLQESLAFGVNLVSRGSYAPFDPSDPNTLPSSEHIKTCSSEYLLMSDEQKSQVQSLMQTAILSLCEKNDIKIDSALIPPKDITNDLSSKIEANSTFAPSPKPPSNDLVR